MQPNPFLARGYKIKTRRVNRSQCRNLTCLDHVIKFNITALPLFEYLKMQVY